MAPLALVKAKRGYAGPPPRLASVDRELYDYLFDLHQKLFGEAAPDDDTSLDPDTISVDHSRAKHLDADDHPQYLNAARHAAIGNNPHGVSAIDVGNDQPLWNANALQGAGVSANAPGDGDVLTWDADLEAWVPTAPAATVTPVELKKLSSTATVQAGAGFGLPLLPTNSLIFAVIVRNVGAIGGATTYQVGTSLRRDAWGYNTVGAGEQNSIDRFALQNPIYNRATLDDLGLYLTPVGGNFVAGAQIQVRVYYWQPPVFV